MTDAHERAAIHTVRTSSTRPCNTRCVRQLAVIVRGLVDFARSRTIICCAEEKNVWPCLLMMGADSHLASAALLVIIPNDKTHYNILYSIISRSRDVL